MRGLSITPPMIQGFSGTLGVHGGALRPPPPSCLWEGGDLGEFRGGNNTAPTLLGVDGIEGAIAPHPSSPPTHVFPPQGRCCRRLQPVQVPSVMEENTLMGLI